jgi:hypothetical protein
LVLCRPFLRRKNFKRSINNGIHCRLFIFGLKFKPIDELLKLIANTFIFFYFGLSLSVPILLPSFLLCAFLYYFFITLASKFDISLFFRTLLFIISSYSIYIFAKKDLLEWLSQTLLSTKHGSDQSSITFARWLSFYLNEWLLTPQWLLLFFLILTSIFIAINLVSKFNNRISDDVVAALTVSAAGIFLNIAIMLTVKRLWGFYLYVGTILFISGILLIINSILDASIKYNRNHLNKSANMLGWMLSFVIFYIAIFFWLPKTITNLSALSVRTKSQEYTLLKTSYSATINFISNITIDQSSPLLIASTPLIFIPQANLKYKIFGFWGPFVEWDKSYDLIILDSANTPKKSNLNPSSVEYDNRLIELDGYEKHVANEQGKCKKTPCFIKGLNLPNGGEILVLQK